MAHLVLRSTVTGSTFRESFVSLEALLERAKRIDPDFYEIMSGGVS